jgi:hypothetical protein
MRTEKDLRKRINDINIQLETDKTLDDDMQLFLSHERSILKDILQESNF